VAVLPEGLQRITSDRLKRTQLKTARLEGALGPFDDPEHVGLALTHGAGTGPAEKFQREEGFPAVVPGNGELIADHIDAVWEDGSGGSHRREV
jgi:hypothetical protein